MRYIHINDKRYFSLGIDEETNKFYLSIPIGKGTMDYVEHYSISKSMVDDYPQNIKEVESFVAECRKGNMFHLSKDQYQEDYLKIRGWPWEPQD